MLQALYRQDHALAHRCWRLEGGSSEHDGAFFDQPHGSHGLGGGVHAGVGNLVELAADMDVGQVCIQ